MTGPDAPPARSDDNSRLDGLAMDLACEIESMLRPVRAMARDLRVARSNPTGWLEGNAGDAHTADALARAIRAYVDEAVRAAIAEHTEVTVHLVDQAQNVPGREQRMTTPTGYTPPCCDCCTTRLCEAANAAGYPCGVYCANNVEQAQVGGLCPCNPITPEPARPIAELRRIRRTSEIEWVEVDGEGWR